MDLLNLATNPMWFFYCVCFPILLALILGFLNSGAYDGGITSYDYYGVTMMIFTIFNTATISANSFMEERIKSPNMRIVRSPVRPFDIHFSKLLASFVYAAACHLLAGVVLWAVAGVNFGGDNLLLVLIVLLLSEFFASGLGVMMCCALKSESATNQILSLVITLLCVLGGVFFSLDGFGELMRSVSFLSPVKWVITAIFQMVYDHNNSLFLPVCAILTFSSVAMVLLSVKFFRTEDYL